MIMDKLTLLADSLAITASNQATTSSYDCGNVTPKRRIGAGIGLSLVFSIEVAPGGDGGSIGDAYIFKAIQATADTLASAQVIAQCPVPKAELVLGAMVEVPIPFHRPSLRYIGGAVDVGAQDTLTVSCMIMPRDMVPAYMAYAKNYTV